MFPISIEMHKDAKPPSMHLFKTFLIVATALTVTNLDLNQVGWFEKLHLIISNDVQSLF